MFTRTSICFSALISFSIFGTLGCGLEHELTLEESSALTKNTVGNTGNGQGTGLLPSQPGTAAPVKPQLHTGDINADGKITISDFQCYLLAVKAQMGNKPAPACQKIDTVHADLNCDDSVNVVDALIVRHQVFGYEQPLKQLSPVYKKKGDRFLHQACMDKYLHMPNNAASWLSRLNIPLEHVDAEDFSPLTKADLVAATITSKDLPEYLTDDEQALLDALKSAVNTRGSSSRTARRSRRSVTRINYDVLAEQAAELLTTVMLRALKNIETDGPAYRAVIGNSIARIILSNYRPKAYLDYLLIVSECDSDDLECREEVVKYPIGSSLIRKQLLTSGYGIQDLSEYIAAQASPFRTASHLALAAHSEALYLKALGIDFTEEFGVGDIEAAMAALEAAKSGLNSGNGSLTTVGSAPAACVNSNPITLGSSSLLGSCSAGETPGAAPAFGGPGGPVPAPDAMTGELNPAFQEVPPFMDENNPCYGIDAKFLFGTTTNDYKKVAGNAGGVAIDLIWDAATGKMQEGGWKYWGGKVMTTAGTFLGTVATGSPLAGDAFGETLKQGYEVYIDGLNDAPQGHVVYDMNGNHYNGETREEAIAAADAKDIKNTYNTLKLAEEAKEKAQKVLNGKKDANPLDDETGNEFLQACGQSSAQSFAACMVPKLPEEDSESSFGSVVQCESICLTAECTEGAFMVCQCKDMPQTSGAVGGNPQTSETPSSYDSSCHPACMLVGGPLLPEQPESMDCSSCVENESNSANLVELCSGGMIPPGLIELCGAIDPAP